MYSGFDKHVDHIQTHKCSGQRNWNSKDPFNFACELTCHLLEKKTISAADDGSFFGFAEMGERENVGGEKRERGILVSKIFYG